MRSIDGDPAVRHILKGALGPGHVRGMDLWWDARRIVFGYAKAKSDSPPKGWLDRRKSYTLRRTEEPIHIFEIGVDGQGLVQLTDGEWSDLELDLPADEAVSGVNRVELAIPAEAGWIAISALSIAPPGEDGDS